MVLPIPLKVKRTKANVLDNSVGFYREVQSSPTFVFIFYGAPLFPHKIDPSLHSMGMARKRKGYICILGNLCIPMGRIVGK